LIWFRQDLRLTDNPALTDAAATGRPLVPVYLYEAETVGAAARWWLHHSLANLSQSLAQAGTPLILRQGKASSAIPALAKELGASAVYWNRQYEPDAIARDAAIKSELKAQGIEAKSFKAQLLVEPFEVATKAGTPFKVFTRFWEAARATISIAPALPAPKQLTAFAPAPTSLQLEGLSLLPQKPNWAAGFSDHWQPGEMGAQAALERFLDHGLQDYASGRDRPDRASTSRLSPHLHFGDIGPAQIWRAVTARAADRNSDKLLAELGWREFAHHLLYHFQDLSHISLRREFEHFPWSVDEPALLAWQRGRTGYPIVDAGMRELWATGWMHNRVRMIVASFLIKHLMMPWQVGAKWFWDTLVDADLANNSASWQWVAGSGADAAPYFRIFNPILQGEKFDPDGIYVKTHVPELRAVDPTFIHKPWLSPVPPANYPAPIVDHATARARALSAFSNLPKSAN
jgi:deoxyribodipyrimidine photo-lyase